MFYYYICAKCLLKVRNNNKVILLSLHVKSTQKKPEQLGFITISAQNVYLKSGTIRLYYYLHTSWELGLSSYSGINLSGIERCKDGARLILHGWRNILVNWTASAMSSEDFIRAREKINPFMVGFFPCFFFLKILLQCLTRRDAFVLKLRHKRICIEIT